MRPSTPAGEPPVILVVDPDPDVRQIFITLLEHRGWVVAATADPGTALDVARAGIPNVIMGEHPLPLQDGSLLCEELMQEETTRGIPFLAVTTRCAPDELRQARRSHPAGVVTKPMFPIEILGLLERLVRSTPPQTRDPKPPPGRGEEPAH